MLLFETLRSTAKRLPDKPALICEDWLITYAEFERYSLALAARLQETGLKKGDRVALLTPNCNEFAIAYFGCHAGGFVCVPLNNRLAPQELVYILNDCGATVLIVEERFRETVQKILPETPSVQKVIHAGPDTPSGMEPFRAVIETGAQPAPVDLTFDDLACVMYTSGTTGLPKGAMMTHRNIMANARNCGAHLNYIEKDVTLIVVPLFHVTGLNSQLVAFVYAGGTCVLMPSYHTAGMIDLVERRRVSFLVAVPTMCALMLINQALEKADFSALHSIAYGGAPMDPATIMELQTRLGIKLYNIYGLTETSSLTTVLPACDSVRKAGSIGLGVSAIRLRIADERGTDLPADTVGELYIKGPNVVGGYWNKPEISARNIENGWLKSGDVARIDPEGFVWVVDRKKDMIIRGGENVYSIEVESALVTHPKVLEAAVAPRPHSIFGEVVHAFIVLKPDMTSTEDEIIDHCKGIIADYKVPASVTFVDALPRNPGGKVLKTRLREMTPPGDAPRR